MKLYNINDEERLIEDNFQVLDKLISPFREFVNKEDYTKQSFSIEEDQKIAFDKTFVLQVNIKDSSSLYFVFPIEDFKKDEIINRVAELKTIRVIDVSSAKEKTRELLKVIKDYNPYFFLYQAKNGIPLFKDELKEIINELELNNLQIFFADKDIPLDDAVVAKKAKETPPIEQSAPLLSSENESVDETKVEEEQAEKPITQEKKKFHFNFFKKKDSSKAKKEKKESNLKQYIVYDLKDIKKNKYHFIFLIVSSFLFGFASAVGFCNAFIGKTIAALFFVCAGVGVFLNTYVFIDYFKERKLKERLFLYSVIFDIAGGLLSLMATYIFYITDKGEVNNNVQMSTITGITIGMVFGMIIISISLAYGIDKLEIYLKNKKEAPKEEKFEESKEEDEEEYY